MNRRSAILRLLPGLLALVVLAAPLAACDLPAEPTAAAVPDRTTPAYRAGVVCLNDQRTSSPYPLYVVPETTTLKIDTLWDPYDHGDGGAHDDGKYTWVIRAGISPLDAYGMPSGRGFFPIEEMAAFFNVRGNRNDQNEAVARAVGGYPSNAFLACSDKPHLFINAAFLKSGRRVAINLEPTVHTPAWAQPAMLYPYSEFPSRQFQADPALDRVLPDPTAPRPRRTVMEGAYKHEVTLQPGSVGIYMGDTSIGIEEVDPRQYRAYLHETTPNVTVTGIPRDPTVDGPHYTVEFPTPTAGASAFVKTKVDCPSVGYYVREVYWCWTEKVETWISSGSLWLTPPGNTYSYTPQVSYRKCSVRINVTCYKPGGGPGSIDYLVTDTRPPLTAKMVLNGANLVCGAAIPDTDFAFTFVDTHPFGDVPFEVGPYREPPVYTQDPSRVLRNFRVFYSYPEFEEGKTTPPLRAQDLARHDPLGPLSFAPPNGRQAGEFIGTYYTPKWVWKEAEVLNPTYRTRQLTLNGSSVLGGLEWNITGKLRFNALAPRYLATKGPDADLSRQAYSAHGHQYPAPGCTSADEVKRLLKMFAVVSDSVGHRSAFYDELVGMVGTTDDAQARSFEEFLTRPNGSPVRTEFSKVPDITDAIRASTGQTMVGNEYPWQRYFNYEVKDGTGGSTAPALSRPEIQVLVFDTRNNRYHLFGDRDPARRDYQFTTYSASSWSDQFKLFYNDPAGGADLMDASPKPAFVAQNTSRFLFYIRAWDNLKPFTRPQQGIRTVKCTIEDFAARPAELEAAVARCDGTKSYDYADLLANPVVWQFREANCDARGNPLDGKNCAVRITATDFAGNTQEMVIKFYLIPDGTAESTIRTLEERHRRTE
jgi:hypothetical protein